ncbi:MAG: hypothetical protein ACRDSK_18365 [Actinophytocola sp.]|uniref:hypothetical protein n=1 Tax=Actinophytocola sp. TaxID=1872138 RepID=UPI003D6B0F32
MRRAWWPLGPASVVVPAVAIVVVVLVMTGPMLGWPYPVWVQTSAQFHQQFTWAGMIAATSACWYAVVLHAKDRIWVRPGAPRLGTPAVVRHLTTLTCWFVCAYLVALAPLVVATVVAGGLGTPDPLAMLSGVLAMVAAVALGYALGAVVPSAATVPLVAVGCYALLVAGSADGERLATVAPVLYLEPELGQRESLPLLAFRIALFVVVTIAAVALAGRVVARVQQWRSLVDAAVYLAVPAVLVAASLVRQPVVFVADAESPTACTEQRGIRYCVHSDNRPRLAELVRGIDPVIARFGTKPANVDQIWDQSLTFRPIDAERARGVELAWLEPDGTVESEIATTAAGVYACAAAQRSEEDTERLTQVALDVSEYLRTGTPVGTLSTMSAAEVREWLARHQDQLHACTLTPDQLPGSRAR